MKKYMRITLAALLTVTILSTTVRAEEAAPSATMDANLDKVKFGTVLKDMLSPESPGFVALGVAENDVVHPESLKKLAIGVLEGLDQNGNFKTGLAFQFSPMLLAGGDSITLRDYQDPLIQAVTRLDIVFAFAKGTGDDKSAKATAGFVWKPIDASDPYSNKDLLECLDRGANAAFGDEGMPSIPSTNPNREEQQKETAQKKVAQVAAFGEKVASCREAHVIKPDSNMALSLQLGFSPLFVSTTGSTSDLKGKGFVTNAIFTVGLKRIVKPTNVDGQIILATYYRNHETTPDPITKGASLERNRFNAGGRLLFGNMDSFMFGAEALYQHAKYMGVTGKDNYVTYTGTLDYPVTDGLWAGLAFGGTSGQRVGGNQTFVGLRFRLNDKAALTDFFKKK